jgi:hypothetical protein
MALWRNPGAIRLGVHQQCGSWIRVNRAGNDRGWEEASKVGRKHVNDAHEKHEKRENVASIYIHFTINTLPLTLDLDPQFAQSSRSDKDAIRIRNSPFQRFQRIPSSRFSGGIRILFNASPGRT